MTNESDNVDLDSELIKRIQERLFDTTDEASGIYTIETQEAVEEFQRQNELRADGLPDPITLEAMGIDTGDILRGIVVGGDVNIGSISEEDYLGAECDMWDPDLPGDTTTDPR